MSLLPASERCPLEHSPSTPQQGAVTAESVVIAEKSMRNRYDPAGVAGLCFAMMALIVAMRVVYDLFVKWFGG
jgi:hypothetical protein